MPIPFAINGLGRIGRALLRVAHRRPEVEVVAVNDLASASELALLVARDSVHGRFPGEVRSEGDALLLDGRRVPVFRRPEVADVPWGETPARIVVEATGRATRREVAARHLRGGVAKVVISAIAEDADAILCPGVDDGGAAADPARRVVSAASCTTHCLALLLAVLQRSFGVRRALMNEVHSYTANQRLVDAPHPDPRRSRAAGINVVPTTTAAPAVVERLLPSLAGRVAGRATRVPTPDVALLDLVFTLERPAGTERIDDAFRAAAAGDLAGLLAVSDEPLVSTDHVGDPHSAVVDLLLTQAVGDELYRVAAWYDNEWGYAHRLADLVMKTGGVQP